MRGQDLERCTRSRFCPRSRALARPPVRDTSKYRRGVVSAALEFDFGTTDVFQGARAPSCHWMSASAECPTAMEPPGHLHGQSGACAPGCPEARWRDPIRAVEISLREAAARHPEIEWPDRIRRVDRPVLFLAVVSMTSASRSKRSASNVPGVGSLSKYASIAVECRLIVGLCTQDDCFLRHDTVPRIDAVGSACVLDEFHQHATECVRHTGDQGGTCQRRGRRSRGCHRRNRPWCAKLPLDHGGSRQRDPLVNANHARSVLGLRRRSRTLQRPAGDHSGYAIDCARHHFARSVRRRCLHDSNAGK